MTEARRTAPANPPPIGLRPGGPPMAFLQDSPKSKNARATLRRLWGYLERQRWVLAGTALLVILTSIADLLGPYLMGLALDTYINTGDLPGLAQLLGWMLLTYILASAGTWLQTYLMAGVAQRAVRDMREDLFARLQALPLRYFDQHAHGYIMSRLTNDLESIGNILATNASQLLSNVLSLVGVIIIIFIMNVPLAVVSLVIMPLTFFLTRMIASRTRSGFRHTQKLLGELNGIIEETISGEQVVKAFVREELSVAQFSTVNRQLQKAALRARVLTNFMGPVMNMIGNLGLGVVACTGGWLAVQGLATVGEIASFISYSGRLSRPLNMIAQLFASIQASLAGAERVFETMDELPESDSPTAVAMERIQGHVRLKDVSFGYKPGTLVLKNVNLEATPGQMIALVGPTGAGKTTIANLLTRFYDIDSGTIEIDGQDVAGVRKDDLRRKLGLVLQDNFLFAATVMENIRYGRLEASDEEVRAAARLANADMFIHRLPQGYQTVLAERGSNLSQGQRQLLAIARAVLADPDILILDEATSNVDTRTEKHLQDALMHLMQGRTSFVIAHRLSTIREADQVLVIQNGEIVERGSHQTLLDQKGFYYNLYMSQFKGQAI
ncbi:MAG TPA: ABC transporter ATP-binding protein [Anaerolineaceae bacterium]|mgnify:CR=1 FL=1|nr:ABC transporter ATP-binding protein [Anaerolineaceae bacterium]HPN52583.1 ABC transporter ATP-binding protein [Anaerolineaceae bacterium]